MCWGCCWGDITERVCGEGKKKDTETIPNQFCQWQESVKYFPNKSFLASGASFVQGLMDPVLRNSCLRAPLGREVWLAKYKELFLSKTILSKEAVPLYWRMSGIWANVVTTFLSLLLKSLSCPLSSPFNYCTHLLWLKPSQLALTTTQLLAPFPATVAWGWENARKGLRVKMKDKEGTGSVTNHDHKRQTRLGETKPI